MPQAQGPATIERVTRRATIEAEVSAQRRY
jgi:hypothetical protein